MVLQFFKVLIHIVKKKNTKITIICWQLGCVEVGQNILGRQKRNFVHILPRFQSSKQSSPWTSISF